MIALSGCIVLLTVHVLMSRAEWLRSLVSTGDQTTAARRGVAARCPCPCAPMYHTEPALGHSTL